MISPCDLESQYQVYKTEIDQVVFEILKSGHYILGPQVEAFEKKFSHYIGSKYAMGVAYWPWKIKGSSLF